MMKKQKGKLAMMMQKKIFSKFLIIILLNLSPSQIYAQEILSKDLEKAGIITECSFKLLNKTTSRSEDIILKKNDSIAIDSIDIKLHDFIISKPSERSEIKALIEISEHVSEIEKESIFKGWIFKSAPAINPLQHKTYDIIVTQCD